MGFLGWSGRIVDFEMDGDVRIIKDLKMMEVSLNIYPPFRHWERTIRPLFPKDDDTLTISGK